VVQRGYYAHVLGEAPHRSADPVAAVRELKKGNAVSGAFVGLVHLCTTFGVSRRAGLVQSNGRLPAMLPVSC
jgi:hypothetical protein